MRTLKLKLMTVLVLALAGMGACATKIHVKNPWPGVPMLGPLRIIGSIIAGPPGANMTDDGDGWYSYTLTDDLAGNATFVIVMYPPASYDPTQVDYTARQDLRITGVGATGQEFGIGALRAIAPEVWIVSQGAGKPPLITEIPQAKKVALLFNPWPDNAPSAKMGNAAAFANMYMSPDANRCGWYGAYFNLAPFTVSFKSLFGNETYGLAGLGDAKPVDLTSYFASADTVFLVPDAGGGALRVLTAIPAGVAGTCSFPLAVTVRDFSIQHPDFEKSDMQSDAANTGLVLNTLGADGKPVRSTKPYNRMSDFAHWFADDSTAPAPLTNYTTCSDLPMSKSNGGLWGYDSYKASDSHSYFPIDNFNRFNETSASQYVVPGEGIAHDDPVAGRKHNFAFCMEMHATFKYKTGQEFSFAGDDDVWAFINKKLVMDLGGPHPALPGKVRLDTLSLTPGTEYPFDFFFCERHTTGSDLAIQTSIFFEQQQSSFVKTTDLGKGSKQYDIFQRTAGSHSCEAPSTDQVIPAKSDFTLSGPSVNPPVALPVGTQYGGITVNTAQTQVVVDTSKITGLRPGPYVITYVTATGRGTLNFTVGGSFAIEFAPKPAVNTVPGASVPVTVQATLSGLPDKRAEPFVLSPATGLLLYLDSALTKPIAAGTVLATDSATGTRKIFATANASGTYKLDLKGGAGNAILMDSYNLTFTAKPIAARRGWYQDLNGDGRIETVTVDFPEDLKASPDRLAFKIIDAAGRNYDRAAAKPEIAFAPGSKSRIVVTLAAPFDKGVTSLVNGPTSGQIFKQDDIPTLDGYFPVDDSVPPIIVKATVMEPDSVQPLKRVLITLSENVNLGPDSLGLAVFKRADAELPAADVKVRKVGKSGEREFTIYIDSVSNLFPIVGDSVALNSNGEAKDLLGNAPARKAFAYLDGTVPKPKPVDLFVTFPNSKKDDPATGAEPQGGVVFIPVDAKGSPLSGDAQDGKCTGVCFPGDNGKFVGPVFHIVTAGPVTYEFHIFNTHGQFVIKGKGRITEKDLPLLSKTNDASGVKYLARVIWTGRTQEGEKAATGAYILQAEMYSEKDPRTGAGQSKDTKRVTFGLIRSFPGS